MNFIILILLGALVGWVASMIMSTNGRQGLLLDIVVGIVGSLLAGFLLTPVFGVAPITQNSFGLPALLISLVGAVILLAVVRLVNTNGRRHA